MIKDTIISDKPLQAPEDIATSLLHLRDEIYNRIVMADSNTTNLKPILWKINSCLYKEYRWR